MESPLVAARQGFEPQYSPSKGEVLPLDDRAMFPRYTINPTLNLALQIRTFRNSNPQSAEISVADIFTIRLLRVLLSPPRPSTGSPPQDTIHVWTNCQSPFVPYREFVASARHGYDALQQHPFFELLFSSQRCVATAAVPIPLRAAKEKGLI